MRRRGMRGEDGGEEEGGRKGGGGKGEEVASEEQTVDETAVATLNQLSKTGKTLYVCWPIDGGTLNTKIYKPFLSLPDRWATS